MDVYGEVIHISGEKLSHYPPLRGESVPIKPRDRRPGTISNRYEQNLKGSLNKPQVCGMMGGTLNSTLSLFYGPNRTATKPRQCVYEGCAEAMQL